MSVNEIMSGDDLFAGDEIGTEGAEEVGEAKADAGVDSSKSKLDPPVNTETPAEVDGAGAPEGAQDEAKKDKPAAPTMEGELTGVEKFLSNYGVKGGIIKFEDGETSKFEDLSEDQKAEVLLSLTKDAVPSVEEKYNLEESEIDFLNLARKSGKSTEDFINDLVDYRLNTVLATKEGEVIDYEDMSADAVFVKHIKSSEKDMTDEEVAQELKTAKSLSTYESTVQTIRDNYIKDQNESKRASAIEGEKVFKQELEVQRKDVVGVVQNINEIGGARISDDVKEYLLGDLMELNGNKDPILMEKIFSDPEKMFKANWFLNYGEDYMTNLKKHYDNEVSKAVKKGYNMAVNGMPSDAVVTGVVGSKASKNKTSMIKPGVGDILTEEDLFADDLE